MLFFFYIVDFLTSCLSVHLLGIVTNKARGHGMHEEKALQKTRHE